jgi:hypothetical protein
MSANIHLNLNSILQIIVFIHICKVFLGIPPNSPLFINYFLKYQLSTANQKVVGVGWGLGHQSHPCAGFLDLPLQTSLRGWHETWFDCENHEPASLPSWADSPSSTSLGAKS